MRLTQLEIFGFKSFAQKIVIPFDPGITAIVGPNGCGKSNVVEAIRWVLGEQRAGTFRSHRMEDVIFAGTRQRKALGMSEVSLSIENRENVLPVEFNEVMLTRRLFRSGESDYLLNKIPCRLLDITNLLMDTGLGQGAYAVMEQGMVDDIVSEKTENRRRILEEAAGITKYKTRRRSTWNRLEATQADLTRIEDIIAEVKRQVDYLGRQVGRARRYQELKQELDQLDVLLGRYRFFTFGAQLDPLQDEFEALDKVAEEGYTRFTSREAELEKARLLLTEAEKAMQEAGIELNRQIETTHEQERILVAVRERRDSAAQILERAARERSDYIAQRKTAQEQRRDNAKRSETTRSELAATEESLQGRERLAANAEEEYAGYRADLDQRQRVRMEHLRQQGEISRALERQRAEREALDERTAGMRAEEQTASAERNEALQAATTAANALAATRQSLESLQDQHAQTRTARAETERAHNHLNAQRDSAQRAAEANQARLQVLEQVRSGYEGYQSGVRTLMLESPHADLFHGVVGDLVDVDAENARAVEVALGESLQALVAHSDRGVTEAIAYLKAHSGRVGILSLQGALGAPGPALTPEAMPGLRGALLAHVRPEADIAPLVERLLHNTFLVDDLQTALALARRYPDAYIRCVTPDGDAVDLFGLASGGKSASEDASVLGRRREIRTLRSVIAHQHARHSALVPRLDAIAHRSQTLDQRLDSLAAELETWREREREQIHQQQNAGADAERLTARLAQLQSENARFAKRRQNLDQSIAGQEEQLRHNEAESTRLNEESGTLAEQLKQSESQRQERREELGALRVERARIAETVQSLERDAERLGNIEGNLHKNIERLDRESAEATRHCEERSTRIAEIEAELKELHQVRETLAAEQDQRRQRWAAANSQNRELQENIGRLQRQLNDQRERRSKLEVRISELKLQTQHIRERLQEEQHCDVETMGAPDEEVDDEAVQQRSDQLRQSLHRLGTVHLGVLEEYEEQKERYDFLCQQRDDLVVAAEDLKKTLSLIDRTARRMFNETFAQIREKFKETYTRFFPGGEADLTLEEGVDSLEAGIEITARPRGKQLQSIALLSGGEKALTAISLLFAIYLVKPSPFCILDEVDAPLDDTNIGRFVRVLKEFAQGTQFVVVTHNKITMAAADTLHGVTMPEEGVSQLVSVRVEDDVLEAAAG
ncbi:MAG: chromosome segregation protein SMC [Candidatus Latescibacterota bacterium]|nr:chromosome segregation protein SMC [Candidatus Latescibacterota bacterium]